MQAVDQVAALLVSPNIDPTISYKDSIINLCQHLKVRCVYFIQGKMTGFYLCSRHQQIFKCLHGKLLCTIESDQIKYHSHKLFTYFTSNLISVLHLELNY